MLAPITAIKAKVKQLQTPRDKNSVLHNVIWSKTKIAID